MNVSKKRKNSHTIEGVKILNPNECELKATRLTDIENFKIFLIRPGCDTAPIHLINRTFSSCKSASLNSFITNSKVLSSPYLRTVLYTADLKSAGMVDLPLQCASNLLRVLARDACSPLRPIQPSIRPFNNASK